MQTQFLFFIWFFIFSNYLRAQNEKWTIQESNDTISVVINEKNISNYLDSLTLSGFYTLTIDSINEKNQIYYINKGKNFKPKKIILDSLTTTLQINISNFENDTELLKNTIIQKLEAQGYSFAQVSSFVKNDTIFINTLLKHKRVIDGFVLNSTEKLPKSIQFHLQKKYKGEIYNDNLLHEIDEDLTQNEFLSLKKSSQVLFLKDSTIIYVYPEKTKQSYFDGILGFTNNESEKLKITGNIDLQLGNVFNSFEKIILHWNSAANSSQDFFIDANFPYLGRTSLGSDTQLKIFRQDSTFVNFYFNENLYYHLNRRTQLGFSGFLQSSTYLDKDTLVNTPYKDFSKNGIGLKYQYRIPTTIRLFQNKFLAKINSNYIKAHIENEERKTQYLISASVQYLYKIDIKNYIATRLVYENLLSDQYINNELFRIGGINSLRGFNENSILANQYFTGSIEYRYLPSEAIYFSFFSDFGQIENTLQNQSNFLIGIGTGMSFQTKFGVFSLQYALGKFHNVPIAFDDSKIHIGIKALF